MNITVVSEDLFSYPNEHFFSNGVVAPFWLAHCISANYAFGHGKTGTYGIAAEFDKRYHSKAFCEMHGGHLYPDCIQQPLYTSPDGTIPYGIFHIVTKRNHWEKPTIQSLDMALDIMWDKMNFLRVNNLAIPRIGCGLDRLRWDEVHGLLDDKFAHIDGEILVCKGKSEVTQQ